MVKEINSNTIHTCGSKQLKGDDWFRRDIEDLQKRYQAGECQRKESITQVPESSRPLLRQIEVMQETTARRAEACATVERSLNSRL